MIAPEDRSKRLRYYYKYRDKMKEKCRIQAKKRYDADPQKKLKQSRKWNMANRNKVKTIKSNWIKRRFFYYKAMMIKSKARGGLSFQKPMALASALMFQWKKQRGLCALTKEKLNRTAQVDHIIPASRGGTDHSDNLQWLCPRANQIKLDMTLRELKAYCLLIASNLSTHPDTP